MCWRHSWKYLIRPINDIVIVDLIKYLGPSCYLELVILENSGFLVTILTNNKKRIDKYFINNKI